MVGFRPSLYSRALTATSCVDEVPAPRSRPTTVRQSRVGQYPRTSEVFDIIHNTDYILYYYVLRIILSSFFEAFLYSQYTLNMCSAAACASAPQPLA
jgi:hypothetical protein